MMETIAIESESYPASRLVSNMAILIGVVWTALMFVVAVAWATSRTPKDISFLSLPLAEIAVRLATAMTIVTPLAVPALASMYAGERLRRNVSVESIRPATALLSFMVVTSIGVIPIVFDGLAFQPEDIVRLGGEVGFYLIVASVSLPVYAVLCRQVLKHDGVQSDGFRDILTRPIMIVLAFLVSWCAFHMIQPYFPYPSFALMVTQLVMSGSIGLVAYIVAVYVCRRA